MSDDDILEAALEILPLLPALLGADAPRVASVLRALLDRATREPADEISDKILVLLTSTSRTRMWMQARMRVTERVRKSIGPPPAAAPTPARSVGTEGEAPYQVVQVMFATDRQASRSTDPAEIFSGACSSHGSLTYGTCDVSVPATHRKGRLEAPSWLRLDFRQDPSRHVVLINVRTLAAGEFFQLAKSSEECLLFIHGYNVTFADAARRLGQMTYDLNFTGLPVLYSWPSRGKALWYTSDEATVDWTAPHLVAFMRDLVDKTGVQQVNVIAHSMGNRIITRALHDLALKPPASFALNQVVLTAPDVDARVFEQMVPEFLAMAKRVTLYASADDMAIVASRNFHGYRRAGDTKDGVVIIKGMDSIDVTGADSSFLGHSYFGSVRTIISDVYYLLRGIEAANRSDLREVIAPLGRYYRYSI